MTLHAQPMNAPRTNNPTAIAATIQRLASEGYETLGMSPDGGHLRWLLKRMTSEGPVYMLVDETGRATETERHQLVAVR